ncbi:MAG: hypothetical protein ACOVSW_22825 [Candidatus Kapaibacteriota bacterium]
MSKTFDTIRRAYTGLSLIILNTALFLVLTIVLLELVAGWLLKNQATAQNTANNLAETAYNGAAWKDDFFRDIRAYQANGGGGQVYEPYSLWKNPDYEGKTFNIVGGYRKTVNPPYTQDDSVMKVFVFGGSTMFCVDTPDEWTIASQISKKLHEAFPGKRFEVSNYGLPGFVNDQEAVLLSKLLMDGKRPDMVIFYDGFNEANLKVGPTKPIPHGLYEMYDQIHRSIKERLWGNLVWKSSLLQLVMRSRTQGGKYEKNPQILKERSEAVCQHYIGTIQFVQKLGAEYGFKTAFFWQPSLLTTAKPLTTEETALKTIVAASNGDCYGILHQTVRRQIFDNPTFSNQPIFDVNNAFDSVKGAAFVDYAHLGPIGNEAIATSIVKHLQQSILQPKN